MLADNRVPRQQELMTTTALRWNFKKVMKKLLNLGIYQQLQLTSKMKQDNVELSRKAMKFLIQRLLSLGPRKKK